MQPTRHNPHQWQHPPPPKRWHTIAIAVAAVLAGVTASAYLDQTEAAPAPQPPAGDGAAGTAQVGEGVGQIVLNVGNPPAPTPQATTAPTTTPTTTATEITPQAVTITAAPARTLTEPADGTSWRDVTVLTNNKQEGTR